MTPRILLTGLAFAFCLLLAACDYTVPLTAKPTRRIEERLTGSWISPDKDTQKDEVMGVRKYDDSTYVVAVDADIYRVYHSDVGGLSLLTVQDLNSSDRKFCIYAWQLSADGDQLTLRRVSTDLVPDTIKDAAVLRQTIKKNVENPKLFREGLVFTRKKP